MKTIADRFMNRSSDKGSSSSLPFQPNFLVDFRYAVVGGVLAAMVTVAGTLAVGDLSGAEARPLLEAMFPTTRFLCSAVMTGSATILALMLTLLSLSHNVSMKAEEQIQTVHFRRIRQIALIDTVTFIGASLLLLFHSIPIGESNEVPAPWFEPVYYILLSSTAIIGGLLVTVVLMLYHTVHDMIHTLGPMEETPLIASEEQQQES
jgi:hypothetical protein